MKWLFLVAGLVAAILAVPILISDLRRAGRGSTLRSLAAVALSLVLLAAALYLAHYLGWFSIAFVALAFFPIGLAARWSLLATRDARDRRETAQDPAPRTAGGRAVRLLAWPLLVVLMFGVVALGAAAAVVASWR